MGKNSVKPDVRALAERIVAATGGYCGRGEADKVELNRQFHAADCSWFEAKAHWTAERIQETVDARQGAAGDTGVDYMRTLVERLEANHDGVLAMSMRQTEEALRQRDRLAPEVERLMATIVYLDGEKAHLVRDLAVAKDERDRLRDELELIRENEVASDRKDAKEADDLRDEAHHLQGVIQSLRDELDDAKAMEHQASQSLLRYVAELAAEQAKTADLRTAVAILKASVGRCRAMLPATNDAERPDRDELGRICFEAGRSDWPTWRDIAETTKEQYRRQADAVVAAMQPAKPAAIAGKCKYCDRPATKTLVWLKDKQQHPARIRLPWCGCDPQVALKRFWASPYWWASPCWVREGVEYEVEPLPNP